MAEKKLVMLVIMLLLSLSVIIFLNNKYNNAVLDKNNMPSKCYTNLQPSPFLSYGKTPSPLTENRIDNYIKIEIKDRDFYYSQASNTGSMRPIISDIATIIFIKPEKEDLKIGDIISFDCEKNQILHRVVNISNGIYATKGDNNHIEDDCITKFENVNGKVIGILY